MVTENENDYSDYIQHCSNIFSGQLFMLGFMFTVLAIILTQLPNPSALQAQLVLLFFSILLDLIGFLSFLFLAENIYFCRRVPPISKRTSVINMLSFFVTIMETGTVTLLFALWNLPNLTIASGICWVLFAIAEFRFIIRPFQKWRKTVN